MKVLINHWLEGAVVEPIKGGADMPIRRCLVIHFTNGASALSSVDYWRDLGGGICAHVIIDRDGTIYQCRPFNRTAGHAGVSRWVDPNTGKHYVGMNNYSIGIELANAGDEVALARKYSKLPLLKARHQNGGPIAQWEQFPVKQLASCTEVARALVTRYRLDDLTGHDYIAPERKNDPGPAFPMKLLREACGFVGLPVVHWT